MHKRNPLRVFKNIDPRKDHDLHIHSNWSQDNLDGPPMAEYLPLAEKYDIHIGFADHFELQYYKKYGGAPRNERDPRWRLNPDSLDSYLDEIDGLKEDCSFVSSGLELDYYPYKKQELQEFIDDYYDQFDIILGSVHETEKHRPVTVKDDFEWLVEKHGSFDHLLQKYWEIAFQLVEDRLFDVVCHPDVIYRFFEKEIMEKNHPDYLNDERVLDLGMSCKDTNTLMEVNLSGLIKPWAQSFPNKSYVYNLLARGVQFIVGSDSHNLEFFENSVLNIRKMNNVLRTRTN